MAVPKPSACFLSLELIKALLNDPSSVKRDEVRSEPQVLGEEGVKGEPQGPTRSVQPTLLRVCHPFPSWVQAPRLPFARGGGVCSDPHGP